MHLDRLYTWEMPARLIFGPGCARSVGEQLRRLGGAKALIVTDRGVVAAGVLGTILEALDSAGVAYALYDGVEPNPPVECAEAGAALYAIEGCDCLLAVGGGSTIDTAKAVGVLVVNPGADLRALEGVDRFANDLPLFVAIPTTCGTGSEATTAAVITNAQRHWKMSLNSVRLVPKVALMDAALLVKLPGPVVAATGMDALCHAIESYTTANAQPISDALDLHAIRTISRWLRPAVANANLEAMAHMLLASTMAGMAFTNSRLTIVHAMSHAVSAHYGVAHGVANAVLLPHVMEFNLIGSPERFADVAEALGERTYGMGVVEAARLAVSAVKELSRDIGILDSLRAYGVDERALEAMVEDAAGHRLVPLNPRRAGRQEIREIYRRAMAQSPRRRKR